MRHARSGLIARSATHAAESQNTGSEGVRDLSTLGKHNGPATSSDSDEVVAPIDATTCGFTMLVDVMPYASVFFVDLNPTLYSSLLH
jgi:hypothetical protein